MKKWLAILTAFLLSVPFAVSPAFAAEASLPTEDPNYVEQSLEEFLKENPNYQGYPDVERYTDESAADTQEWYEWTQSGSSWYLYRKYYDGIYILFHTGLRISEFCGLTILDSTSRTSVSG